jgi:O-antigen/teichoic acid export membrane protein
MYNKTNTERVVLGSILILVGLFFLMRSWIDFDLSWNWWALFILIPAVGSLNQARGAYQAQGRLTETARGPLIVSMVLFLVTAFLLFNLSWGLLWPLFLILFGAGALVAR